MTGDFNAQQMLAGGQQWRTRGPGRLQRRTLLPRFHLCGTDTSERSWRVMRVAHQRSTWM